MQLIFDDSSWSLSKADSLPYSEIDEIRDATKIATTMPIVSNQSKSWNKNIVLIGGENGAGKTTTFRMIMGLLEPDEGTILLNGEKITYKNTDLIGL